MRKNFIKYLACALVAVMLLGTTAFAATTTTTTYDGEYITVSTTVTGATGDEQVTYLVHNSADADIADSEIVYINQKPATSGSATFDYKVAMTDAEAPNMATKIISGSTSGAALATAGDNIDLENIVIDNQTGEDGIYTLSKAWIGTEDEATLTLVDGNWLVNDVEYTGPITVTEGATYVITKGEEEPELPSLKHDKAESSGDGAEKYVTVFATFANLPEGAEYGVQLTVNGEAVFFKALGNVDGKYAVKLVDNGTGLLAGEHSVNACYFVDGEYFGATSSNN